MNFLDFSLECNGRTLRFGKAPTGEKREFGITKITGLESSELEVQFTDNALVDGSTLDGRRIKSRSVHIEATLRDDRNNDVNRQRIIKFFNPKYTGKMIINHSGVMRNIEYELEGWTFEASSGVHDKLSVIVDLKCADPFMKNMDNFGQNMADIRAQTAFPWRVAKNKVAVPIPYKGLALAGQITGYRKFKKEVHLPNDGDVPAGVQIKFIAARGVVKNPKITLLGTGQFMRVVVSMERGDVLMIDTNVRHQVIELNGVNIYQKIDRRSEPFELCVGSNYIEYDADENYTNLDVRVFYTPLYMGV